MSYHCSLQKGWLCALTLLHSERPKLHRVLAVPSAIGLNTSSQKDPILEPCLKESLLAQGKPRLACAFSQSDQSFASLH